jgi:UDP-N-acetylglucosamine 2-epimerase
VNIATIVGARPQFIKAGPVSHAIAVHNRTVDSEDGALHEVVIHTGQHYDYEMSAIFFETLGLAAPKYNLGVGSGSHGTQLAKMIEGLEVVLEEEMPDLVLVYGDTNSTLAGALMAHRVNIPIAHVEAGLRSFNRRMAEECNRMIADRLSSLLFAPTETAVQNLGREGITEGVYQVGDVMHEAAMFHGQIAESESTILQKLSLIRERYALATVHRAENTDDALRLRGILEGLVDVSRSQTVVWPVHPRMRKQLSSRQEHDLPLDRLLLTDPVSYRDMLTLEKSASVVLTDSGGVQKEAMWLGVPCVTLRDETEWVETVKTGRNELAGCRREKIRAAFEAALRKPRIPLHPEENGTAPSTLIVQHLLAFDGNKAKPFGFRA